MLVWANAAAFKPNFHLKFPLWIAQVSIFCIFLLKMQHQISLSVFSLLISLHLLWAQAH